MGKRPGAKHQKREPISGIRKRKKKMPGYDSGYKHELSKQEQFIHFMKKYVQAEWCKELTPDQVSLCDREFLLEDYQKRQADLVYRIQMRERSFYVFLIMELQSTVDHTMPFRLLTLIYALQLKIFLATPEKERKRVGFRLPVVIPVLFYNGKQKWTVHTEYRQFQEGFELFGRHVLNFEYYLVDLNRIGKEYILNSNMLIDNILALDKEKKDQKLPDTLEKVMKRVGQLNERDRADFRKWLEYVLMEVSGEKDQRVIQQVIQVLQKGDKEMMHGIQMIIKDKYKSGVRAGEKIGERRGEKRGIKVLIETCRDLQCSREDTLSRIREKFGLSEKTAHRYMEEYWKND